jgi:hypothetical protein
LVAHLQIGAEVKIGATKLIAQVDRVINDLSKQARIFESHNPNAIRVGFVGVNFAQTYTGHEGDRQYVAKTPQSVKHRSLQGELIKLLDLYLTSY